LSSVTVFFMISWADFEYICHCRCNVHEEWTWWVRWVDAMGMIRSVAASAVKRLKERIAFIWDTKKRER
jgi:hypothetical protein